ncbi:hypothetical protein NDU88_003297 [Pleurodeles waltl]|uniref:Uncharacterized protein n=1 Tax=Pleurodeles waltl TaxID=8319 RepID=A0AAV7SF77_PLEWA|nr:hypothetical protein NDU88_003297 [Pleurodeles waltl]
MRFGWPCGPVNAADRARSPGPRVATLPVLAIGHRACLRSHDTASQGHPSMHIFTARQRNTCEFNLGCTALQQQAEDVVNLDVKKKGAILDRIISNSRYQKTYDPIPVDWSDHMQIPFTLSCSYTKTYGQPKKEKIGFKGTSNLDTEAMDNMAFPTLIAITPHLDINKAHQQVQVLHGITY